MGVLLRTSWVANLRIVPICNIIEQTSTSLPLYNLYIVSPLDICRRGLIKSMMMMMMICSLSLY